MNSRIITEDFSREVIREFDRSLNKLNQEFSQECMFVHPKFKFFEEEPETECSSPKIDNEPQRRMSFSTLKTFFHKPKFFSLNKKRSWALFRRSSN